MSLTLVSQQDCPPLDKGTSPPQMDHGIDAVLDEFDGSRVKQKCLVFQLSGPVHDRETGAPQLRCVVAVVRGESDGVLVNFNWISPGFSEDTVSVCVPETFHDQNSRSRRRLARGTNTVSPH